MSWVYVTNADTVNVLRIWVREYGLTQGAIAFTMQALFYGKIPTRRYGLK